MLEPKKPDDPTGGEGAKLDQETQTAQTEPSTQTDGQEGTTTSSSDDLEK